MVPFPQGSSQVLVLDSATGKVISTYPVSHGTIGEPVPTANVSWSADGRWLAYLSLPKGGFRSDLGVVDTKTGRNVESVAGQASVLGAAFSADSHLYYLASGPGGREVRFGRYDPSADRREELANRSVSSMRGVYPILVPCAATGRFYTFWTSQAAGDGGVWSVGTDGRFERLVSQEDLSQALQVSLSEVPGASSFPVPQLVDGGGISANLYMQFWLEHAGSKKIAVLRIDLAQGSARRVFVGDRDEVQWLVMAPSADGRVALRMGLAPGRSSVGPWRGGVYLTDPNLGNERLLSDSPARGIVWLDSHRLLCLSSGGELFRLDVGDGSGSS